MDIIKTEQKIGLKANNYKQATNVNTSSSFSEVLNQVTSKSKTTDDTIKQDTATLKDKMITGNPLIDNLPAKNKGDVLYAINKLNKIFDINMFENSDKFFKKDGSVNITRILGEYGGNVSASELNDLSDAINTLKDNGLLSDEDYFAAIKWIATKQESRRIKMQHEKNEDSISNLMWKPNKSHDNKSEDNN